MKLWVKLMLTGISLILIFSGGVDFGLTTLPGIAIFLWVWGIEVSI